MQTASSRIWAGCDNTPSRPPVFINFFETILSWPVIHLVVPNGVSHISLWPQEIQPREWEKKNKEQTNNKGFGQLKEQEGEFCNNILFQCICRLLLACISSEISTRLLECQHILTGLPSLLPSADRCRLWTANSSCLSSSLAPGLSHADWSLLLSSIDCPSASPFANCLLSIPFSTALASLWPAFPTPLPVASKISSIFEPLFGFAPKQTQRSSAWRTSSECHIELLSSLPTFLTVIPRTRPVYISTSGKKCHFSRELISDYRSSQVLETNQVISPFMNRVISLLTPE